MQTTQPSCVLDLITSPLQPYTVRELEYVPSTCYKILGGIGGGAAGHVYLAVNMPLERSRPFPKWVAIKVLKKNFKGRAECDIQPRLRHPNIVESNRGFIWKRDTYVVYKLCAKGSLGQLIRAFGRIHEDRAAGWIVQLAGGIKYIHSKGVFHRDMKPDNIYLDEDNNVKIGDFSLAAYTRQRGSAETVCGTLGYMAPEMFCSEPKGHEVDIWGLGIIIFIMLLASQPFYASGCESCKVSSCNKTYPREHNMEIRHKICAYDYEWPRGLFPTAAAKDLITRILVSAKSRPTPDDIIEDLFFTQELDKHLHLERCRRAGVGRNDMGDIFPCVGGICSGYFWASPFQSGL